MRNVRSGPGTMPAKQIKGENPRGEAAPCPGKDRGPEIGRLLPLSCASLSHSYIPIFSEEETEALGDL